jgi:hypothetical protein
VKRSNFTWSTGLKHATLIAEGGSGVKNFLTFNQVLMGKWLWCYTHERKDLWRVVVDSKYGNAWGGWCSSVVHGLPGMGLRKNIRRG